MFKKIILILMSSILLFSSEYILDNTKSEVYYDAKKEQLFATHTIISINKGLSGLLQGNDAKYSGKLSVDATNFDSKSSLRDDNVDKYLNVDKHPFISYKYTIQNNISSGEMTVNGVSKEISFPVIMKENEDGLYIEGNIKIKYTDFGMETPNNLIVSAHDDLVIGAKLYFVK